MAAASVYPGARHCEGRPTPSRWPMAERRGCCRQVLAARDDPAAHVARGMALVAHGDALHEIASTFDIPCEPGDLRTGGWGCDPSERAIGPPGKGWRRTGRQTLRAREPWTYRASCRDYAIRPGPPPTPMAGARLAVDTTAGPSTSQGKWARLPRRVAAPGRVRAAPEFHVLPDPCSRLLLLRRLPSGSRERRRHEIRGLMTPMRVNPSALPIS